MGEGRRKFLTGLGLAAAGAALPAPALADPAPTIEWKLASSFVPALDLIYGGAETLAKALSELTDGRFTLRLSPAGEIAPALEALEAAADGRADCAHTALAYGWTQDPSLIFATAAPFGMNARQHAAWLAEGGGGDLVDGLLADRKLAALPLGNTGGQMAGWFRKEIRGAADISGLKMRIGGFAGKVFQTLGAEPVAIARDAIYAALEGGTLDAFEYVGPYDDEKLGERKDGPKQILSKVAPFYYFPGWWKGGMQMHLVVNREKLDALPKTYQSALRAAAAIANASVLTRYDAANPGALKRLALGGAQLRLFPQEVMEACFKTANDLYAELGEQDPRFKKIADSYLAFHSDQYLWWQVEEYSYDNFLIRQRRSKT